MTGNKERLHLRAQRDGTCHAFEVAIGTDWSPDLSFSPIASDQHLVAKRRWS